MKEVFKKIKQKFEEQLKQYDMRIERRNGDCYFDEASKKENLDGRASGIEKAIEIVDQVAEECAKVSVEGDLISRSALLEDLRKCEEKCKGALILPSWLYACRIIKNQPSIQNDKWIPCSVDMPKELGRYIVTLKDGRSLEAIYDNISKRFIMYEHEVIAWQPLPAPYRKE